ncbi:murein hydrolase activator NlpD [Candidatus Erwinia haradaeae]|uniref:Murein hydrolase activator NlpD n=1 Tax=Candidatus Erwinia haradaeae TaxID=1922217 RepID=A0A451D1U0_9GAMM|nr:murein hydrolase activator NlpD [Candidatus Erwinia haradaeae]VFP79589.1 Murein hydrolase activator NlpD [Candidatus Erwinia haradaeae]
MKIRRIMYYVLAALLLIDFSNYTNTQSPISTIQNNFSKKIDYHPNNLRYKNVTNKNDVSSCTPVYALYREFHTCRFNNIQNVILKKNDPIIYPHNYHHIPHGSYNNTIYIVRPGDTLFYIAWITGNNMHDLAKRNHITAPYHLSVSQVLQVSRKNHVTIPTNHTIITTHKNKQQNPISVSYHIAQTIKTTKTLNSIKKPHLTNIQHLQNIKITNHNEVMNLFNKNISHKKSINKSVIKNIKKNKNLVSNWNWPTSGKIIKFFSLSEGGNKGIDIAGAHGYPIVSAAYGRVVYTSNTLRGYGNLIIIKHKNNYLTAYAHNASLFVHKNQIVKAGQKIATMGRTGTNSVKLHFEIRYKGKSVNPLLYLPPR